MKENTLDLILDLNKIFLSLISYRPTKTHIWEYITSQNSCDVTTVFIYSHLNTRIQDK